MRSLRAGFKGVLAWSALVAGLGFLTGLLTRGDAFADHPQECGWVCGTDCPRTALERTCEHIEGLDLCKTGTCEQVDG